MHHQNEFDEDVQKPEIISYYNRTKGDVDALEENCSMYCTGRRTRRWPMAIFFHLLDISSVNSFVLYNSFKNNTILSRSDYMKRLAFELVKPELERRYENTCILQEIRFSIGRVLGVSKNLKETPIYEGKLEKKKLAVYAHLKKKKNDFPVLSLW